ncbi:MAG: nucleoside triphosphate pyrophosphohydrolase [Pseudomonadota bacterium]|nr:nucleoside triphosphate pyrophosphohydrolase [Pseudomonadota bacterium]
MTAELDRLVEIMARLRDPVRGCPWDLEQTFKTIAPYTLEETYEVVEAIENDDVKAMAGELGDLLFQIVFHAQIGREAGLFDLDSIAKGVADKMVERHPHVFAERQAKNAEDVLTNWESDKAARREAEAAAANRSVSALDDVSTALPATTRAVKLQKRAARVGFDWAEAGEVLAKIKEEINELEQEIAGGSGDAMEDEMGDMFFAIVNLARKLEIDPETALRRTNRKFEKRFRAVESDVLGMGKRMEDTPLQDMEALWIKAKNDEKKSVSGQS